MKWWDRFGGKVKKRIIGGALAVVLGVVGINLPEPVTQGAVEFFYIISEGGESEGE